MLAFTRNEKITPSYAILTIGMADLQRALNARIKTASYRNIPLYVVDECYLVVQHDNIYFCSCGRVVCWHVYGVMWGEWVGECDGDKYFGVVDERIV
ncbi:hypothetical protein THOM_1041 [Trachipleistophora hominis]|uniref:Uncharacterized protein n=1 Tax=Trachipleistophora hominis TaxID=72359 RepID=L7JX31_TRAHO|nr:hypothetical protein THOM_1041 [Trachipleistophora hominis]